MVNIEMAAYNIRHIPYDIFLPSTSPTQVNVKFDNICMPPDWVAKARDVEVYLEEPDIKFVRELSARRFTGARAVIEFWRKRKSGLARLSRPDDGELGRSDWDWMIVAEDGPVFYFEISGGWVSVFSPQ